jgi:hypothetical protein
MRMSSSSLAVLVAVLLASSPTESASAQDVLLDFKSPVPATDLIHCVVVADWDGDGVADLAVGAPGDSSVAPLAGAVRIHSGADGSVLMTLNGSNAVDLFGGAVAAVPDLDGDGIDDLAVGAQWTDYSGTDAGSVYLYSGGTGVLQRRIDGPAIGTRFGGPIGPIGDVDGDGIADLFIAHFGTGDVVHVHSGFDGHRIVNLRGKRGDMFGCSVAVLDDLDGDGARDLLIGARFHPTSLGQYVGRIELRSTLAGTTLWAKDGTFAGEQFGICVAALPDLDGDGTSDCAISGNVQNNFGTFDVFVHSGVSGSELARIQRPSTDGWLDRQVVSAGDVNGDGVGDLAVAGIWLSGNTGYAAAHLVSGKTFDVIGRIPLDIPNSDLSAVGDLDGDGRADLAVCTVDSQLDSRVRVFAGDDLYLAPYPRAPAANVGIAFVTREGVPANATILVLEGVDGVPTFQAVSGVASFDATGTSTYSATVPPGLAGHTMTFRSYAIDATGRVIASAAQEVVFL